MRRRVMFFQTKYVSLSVCTDTIIELLLLQCKDYLYSMDSVFSDLSYLFQSFPQELQSQQLEKLGRYYIWHISNLYFFMLVSKNGKNRYKQRILVLKFWVAYFFIAEMTRLSFVRAVQLDIFIYCFWFPFRFKLTYKWTSNWQ